VVEINNEILIKHPLQNRWTLWFFDNTFSKNWEDNQRLVINFDTIEDFWRFVVFYLLLLQTEESIFMIAVLLTSCFLICFSLFNHIKPASELRQGCDYSLFKENIRPMWEDQANKRGGRWLITLEKKQRFSDLDRFWLDLVSLSYFC